MENASNQDDGKAVDNVVSNHGKAVDNVVSNLLQPKIDTQILNAFMEVDPVFNPAGMDVDVESRRGGFPSGAKKEWGLSPKAKVRVLHTAQLDVTVNSNH
nr:hypothetical protein [Tanacetum cinerariifolium]